MDDIVKAALVKWPNVPHCYAWLGLDARGNWYMRDDRVQAIGGFASGVPGAKGSLLRHEKLVDFIQRNYEHDERGCWYFQNGPQRVYVELERTPLIWRVGAGMQIAAHTGQAARLLSCNVDEEGLVYLATDLGFGLVHTQDVVHIAQAIEDGRLQAKAAIAAELPVRHGYVTSPAAQPRTKLR
ncbi:MAG: DUF2946 family protein [Ramlibacter sp.]|jgi:hypothetical protein|nr:DUF2946 family protein [Ramlibacter sp.]